MINCVFLFAVYVFLFCPFLSYLFFSGLFVSILSFRFLLFCYFGIFWSLGGVPGKLLQLCDLLYGSVTVVCIRSSINIINLLTFSRKMKLSNTAGMFSFHQHQFLHAFSSALQPDVCGYIATHKFGHA